MIQIRRSDERGAVDFGWLRSKHTFSFGNYVDPRFMQYRALRVINEDHVDPGEGFGTHPHRDAEIVSYVLDGTIRHRDSMGHTSEIRPGDVQVMSAGRGVSHSEYNASKEDPLHLLQIWFLPDERNVEPRYDQKQFPTEVRKNQLRLLVSKDGRDGSLWVHQDVDLYGTTLDAGAEVTHALGEGRGAWIQVARGRVALEGRILEQGDGAAVEDLTQFTLKADEPSEVLVFDLA